MLALPLSDRHPTGAACSHFVESTDLEEHASAQQGWSLRYEQLSSGPFHARLRRVELPGLTLLREDIGPSVRQRGRLAPDVYGFAIPLTESANLFFNGQRLLGPAVMCGKGDDIDMVTPENFSMVAVVVERSLLNPLWERMYQKPLAQWLEKQLILSVVVEKALLLRDLHLEAMAQAEVLIRRCEGDQAVRMLRDEILIEWIEALPAHVSTEQSDSAARRKSLVDRACELMLTDFYEPLSVLDVCTRLGTSRRKLNYCFQEVLGTTPVKYLRSLRLNGARSDLRHAVQGAQVQDVAARWGFWHLSQFGQDYRLLFGELPSATLQRSISEANRR